MIGCNHDVLVAYSPSLITDRLLCHTWDFGHRDMKGQMVVEQ
jgi:hypothetical protein